MEKPEIRRSQPALLTIPNELHIAILSRLSFAEQLVAAQVCEIWQTLLLDIIHLRKVRYTRFAPQGSIYYRGTDFLEAGGNHDVHFLLRLARWHCTLSDPPNSAVSPSPSVTEATTMASVVTQHIRRLTVLAHVIPNNDPRGFSGDVNIPSWDATNCGFLNDSFSFHSSLDERDKKSGLRVHYGRDLTLAAYPTTTSILIDYRKLGCGLSFEPHTFRKEGEMFELLDYAHLTVLQVLEAIIFRVIQEKSARGDLGIDSDYDLFFV
ncbi:hypothetical protein H072_2210 [Dactylellina haptotyla CBS 200.50]|uniref:F-box domain-containing protein n=1 Tax=Dactylellina haptotyla (strain CBS 200.50) TaxID=1284197 RepID=S8ALK5_DACHA|nr:hypothetical protein H072_2210 [Dactylellina haptotyla CBS 200.50]